MSEEKIIFPNGCVPDCCWSERGGFFHDDECPNRGKPPQSEGTKAAEPVTDEGERLAHEHAKSIGMGFDDKVEGAYLAGWNKRGELLTNLDVKNGNRFDAASEYLYEKKIDELKREIERYQKKTGHEDELYEENTRLKRQVAEKHQCIINAQNERDRNSESLRLTQKELDRVSDMANEFHAKLTEAEKARDAALAVVERLRKQDEQWNRECTKWQALAQERLVGTHCCPEWDEMELVAGLGFLEFSACTCKPIAAKERK